MLGKAMKFTAISGNDLIFLNPLQQRVPADFKILPFFSGTPVG